MASHFDLKLVILHQNIDVFSLSFYFSYWWLQSTGIQKNKSHIKLKKVIVSQLLALVT